MQKFKLLFGVFVIITIFVTILAIPDFYMYPGTDYGVYFNNGRLLSHGEVPYRDFWDHKTPGIYIYLALWQSLFGSGWYSAKASIIPIYILWGIAIFVFTKVIVKQNIPSILSALVGVYFAMRLGFDPPRNGAILILSTSVELLALSLLHTTLHRSTSPTKRYWIMMGGLAGLLSSGAVLIRQTSITPFLVLGFLFVSEYIVKKKKDTRFVLGGFAIGALLPFAIAALLANAVGLTARSIYQAIIVYNRLYHDYMAQPVLKKLVSSFLSDLIWWAPTFAGILYLRHNRKKQIETRTEDAGLGLIYLCLGISLLLTILSAKAQGYYRIQYYPYLFIISCYIIFSFIKVPKNPSLGVTVGTLIISILSLFSAFRSDIIAAKEWYSTARQYDFEINRFPDQIVANEVLLHANNETIFVYGNRAWIYTLTGASSPNEHYYSSGIFWQGYLSQDEFNVVLSEFEESPPGVIVYWPNRPDAANSVYNSSYVVSFENFVSENYRLEREIAFDSAWPYSLTQPIAIYVLGQDH